MGPGTFRLFLALVVVLHHSTPLRLGGWAVYVFFILSGYWISLMWEKKYALTHQPLVTFLVSRWWRLAPVFVVCSALTLLAARIQLFTPMSAPVPADPLLWSLRQIPILGSAAAGRILPPTWSLDVEMQFYLLAGLLFAAAALQDLRKRRISLVVLVGALVGGVIFVGRGGAPETAMIFPWVGFFAAGIAIYVIGPQHFKQWAKPALVGVALCVLGFVFVPELRSEIWRRGSVGHEAGAADWSWTPILLFLSAVAVVPFAAWNVQQQSGKLDRMLGNWAYPLYLFHWLPRDWYYSVSDRISLNFATGGMLLLNFAFALLGSFLILYLVDRPLDGLRARWVASRSARCLIPATSRNTAGKKRLHVIT